MADLGFDSKLLWLYMIYFITLLFTFSLSSFNLREKKNLIFYAYPHIHHFWCFLFRPIDLSFCVQHVHSAWRISFSIYYSANLFLMNCLSFCLSDNVVFFILIFKRYILLNIKLWLTFSVSTENISSYCLLPTFVFHKLANIPVIISFYVICHFSLAVSGFYFLFFIFKSLNMMWLVVVSLYL